MNRHKGILPYETGLPFTRCIIPLLAKRLNFVVAWIFSKLSAEEVPNVEEQQGISKMEI